ncbi:MAG TPA: dihydroorotate dehydrogenase-like protein [Polyangiaceae bacterium]
MDLRTQYLGLDLPHPFMPGASPMVDDLDTVKRLEDAGAAAIVMHSLFEEQIVREQARTVQDMESNVNAFAEATSFFPQASEFRLGPHEYLDQLRRIKEAVALPVIASLNGVTASGWLEYARLIEQAGANALELNAYYIATNPEESAADVEQRTLDIVLAVRRHVKLPIAVKLSPFHSSLANLAAKLEAAGAKAIVLFNRFYQPDIDIETLEVVPQLKLSDPSELLLRLRWLAILSGRSKLELACSGGVHSGQDALRALAAGAQTVQMVSALLRHGPAHLKMVREGVELWLEQHEYESLAQLRGSMNLARCPDPAMFERGNYMRILQSWRG